MRPTRQALAQIGAYYTHGVRFRVNERRVKLRVGDEVPANTVIKIRITLTDGNGKTESKTVTVQVGANDKISKAPSAGTQ